MYKRQAVFLLDEPLSNLDAKLRTSMRLSLIHISRSIVQRFGTDTLDVLEYHPEKLLEIRGITEQKLEEIKTCYAESRAMRDIMELLTPFQVTPVTAMKIYPVSYTHLDVYKRQGPGIALDTFRSWAIPESKRRLCIEAAV